MNAYRPLAALKKKVDIERVNNLPNATSDFLGFE